MSSSTGPTETSPLRQLPAGLCNIIYGHVLSTDQAVSCQPYSSNEWTLQRLRISSLTDTSPSADLNQLKFTCRELHLETSGLLPTSPHLTFLDAKGTTDRASILCAHSLGANSPDTLRSLIEIHVLERAPFRARKFWARIFDIHGISSLLDFCRTHPQISVNVHLSSTRASEWNPPSAIALQVAHLVVRKEVTSLRFRHSFSDGLITKCVKNMARICPSLGADAPVFPDNLKMWPVGSFYGDQVRYSAERRTLMSWYENGF